MTTDVQCVRNPKVLFRGINPKEKCRFRDFIRVYQAIKVIKLKESRINNDPKY